MKKNIWLFQDSLHLVAIGDKVRRQVTTVELHAFNNIKFSVEALGFFNSDDTFVADLFHSLSNHRANFAFTIG